MPKVSDEYRDARREQILAAARTVFRRNGFHATSMDEVAEAAGEMLDELENHLNSGAAEVARPALLRALTRLRKIIEQADDSSGSIGDQCQRAADLYARACRLGAHDRVKLATWLVKFRADSPGWPNLVLADFVDAFDEQALATYRRAVAALAADPELNYADAVELQLLLEALGAG